MTSMASALDKSGLLANRSPYELVGHLFHLNGERFDVKSYPYLEAIYNTKARRVCLFTSRQVSKSTTLASKLVLQAVMRPRTAAIYLAPLADQADVFSIQRLRDFTINSPFIKKYFFSGPKVVDQVHRKVFSNDSIVALSYAQTDGSRVRGRSISNGGSIVWDEIQDIMPHVIPVVEELAFRAADCSFWYCGTPLSMNNHMEVMRSQSTGCEWAVRCPATGCKKWNHEWDDRNIGTKGVICRHCGQPLDTRDGQWVARRKMDIHLGKDSRVDRESYRIPQLIVKPIMDIPTKWLELLGKQRNYSAVQFANEVLGMPAESGSQPITQAQLEACCNPDRPNAMPEHTSNLPPLVMGVDWAVNGGINAGNSFTTAVIGAWNPFPSRFEIYYYKVFKGAEAGPDAEMDWIKRAYHAFNIRLIAADWGCGQVQNINLVNALGEGSVAQMWHAGGMGNGVGGKAPRAKWEPKTRKYHLSRTRVLTDTFEAFRNRQVTLPRISESQTLFDHFLAVSMEYNERNNTQRYVNIKPDDLLHATTYCMLGGELLLNGDFTGHMGTAPRDVTSESMDDVMQIASALDMYY
jgi:hypothetical protein